MRFLSCLCAMLVWGGALSADSFRLEGQMLKMRHESERARLYRAILKHPEDYPHHDLSAVRKALAEIEDDCRQAQTWRHPAPTIGVPPLPRAPRIDGTAEPDEWQAAKVMRGSYLCSSTEFQHDGSIWRLGYHGRKIYGSVFFPDSDMTFYRGRQGEPRTSKRIWQGDCLEVFIQPDEQVPYYVELLLRPGDSCWALDHVLGEGGFWTTIHFHFGIPVETAGRVLPDGYELEFAFEPGSFDVNRRDRELRPGDAMRMAMIRMILDIRQSEQTVQRSFFPLLHSGHNIFGYAVVKLE